MMTGDQLRAEVESLRISHAVAAERLGLSPAGLRHQMNGTRPVSRQTELLLARLRVSPSLAALRQPPRVATNATMYTDQIIRAVRDLDQFQFRYALGREVEQMVSRLRLLLLRQLEEISPTRPEVINARRRFSVVKKR